MEDASGSMEFDDYQVTIEASYTVGEYDILLPLSRITRFEALVD